MNHFSFELSLIAMIPGLFLCGYVFYKDRVEKEPVGLLALLFGAGVVGYIPSFFLQKSVVRLIDGMFADQMSFSAEGALTYSSSGAEILHNILCAVFGFSLIQICIKWVILYFGTHKNKNFNYLFDGVVYSVFLSLGFAVAENIHFALQNDADMIVVKLMTSIPCHLFVSIMMGYYYTMWHTRFIVNRIEKNMLSAGIVKEDKIRSSAGWLACSIIIPMFVNSLYSFTSSNKNQTVVMLFFAVVFLIYGLSFVTINHIASKETDVANYLCRVIAKGHPELTKEDIEKGVSSDGNADKEGNK